MSDRFFTFMLVPERSDRIRKFSIPASYLKVFSGLAVVSIILGFFIFFDYVHLLSEVAENKKLRVENHNLRIDVQNAQNKLEALDQSVGRLKSFAQKLRVISNLDSPGASRLLEAPAPQNTGGGYGVPAMEEDSGAIEDPNSSENPSSPNKDRRGHAPGANRHSSVTPDLQDAHGQLEYQRSLSLLDEAPEVDVEDLEARVGQILSYSTHLNETVRLEEQNFASLQEHIQDRVARLRSTPSILPARGWISSEFGYRVNPFSGTKTFHAGIDIANFIGTPVYAPADGTVSFAGIRGGFGNVVQLDHGYNLMTRYGHNSRVLVTKGDRIKRGQKIAEIGSSGRSTGPHLHYEVVLNGKVRNPRLFILEDTF